MGDLFRLMTEQRREMTEMRSENASKFGALDAKVDALQSDMTSVKGTVEAHTGELEAIRNVVDDDLASHDQMLRVEGDIVEIKKTQRQHGKKIDRLAESMDRAGIPVR